MESAGVRAYLFLPEFIRRLVPDKTPGAYMLGDLEEGKFVPRYVGRSDRNLQQRLANHNYLYHFTYFAFIALDNPQQAFLTESKWWHDCESGGIALENKIHPASPNGSAAPCPYCDYSLSVLPILQKTLPHSALTD